MKRLAGGEQSFHVLLKETGLQKTALASHLSQLLDAKLISKPTNSRGMYAITTDGSAFVDAIQATFTRSIAKASLAASIKARGSLSEIFLSDFFGKS